MFVDPVQKRNVFLLFAAQALFQTSSVMVVTMSGLVGLSLAPDKSLATLSVALMVIAAAASMIPAAIFMQKFGQQKGFILGSSFGILAGIGGASGVWLGDFWLFVLGNMLVGCYQGFAQYYRFAAADQASPAFKSRAISWVIAGGIVAALAAPNLVRFTQDLGPMPFMVSYLVMLGLGWLAMLVLARLRLPPLSTAATGGAEAPRHLSEIIRQLSFLTAVTGSTVGFAAMIMVMTATPLAMQMCGLPLSSATTVIQWHVLGMFVPSFFTSRLIERWGVLSIMAAGAVILTLHVAIALAGVEFINFLSGLILLGLGWNFLFIGGTTLLTTTYRPSERAKTQAAHDFIMFGSASCASLLAGGLLNAVGWEAVNLSVLPFLGLTLLMTLLLRFIVI